MSYKSSNKMTAEEVIETVFAALREAENKHPGWPIDPVHAAGILGEEAGELMQAAIDYIYNKGDFARMRQEAAQCAATGIRFLLGMSFYRSTPVPQEPLKLIEGSTSDATGWLEDL